MRGLDDGPDGLNNAAFDRAVGLRHPCRLTDHSIVLTRAQAVVDDCTTTIALCDVALGRELDEDLVQRLAPEFVARIGWLTRREAAAELDTGEVAR